MKSLLLTLSCLAGVAALAASDQSPAASPSKTNIVYILADDLGYADLPYSNDMGVGNKKWHFPRLPLYKDDTVIETEPDQSQFTQRYTKEAIKFIGEHKDGPFFVYLPHTMIHGPLAASAGFKGKSTLGLLGDAIEEIDSSVGEIMRTLKELQLDGQTLVIFTSDSAANVRPAMSKRQNETAASNQSICAPTPFMKHLSLLSALLLATLGCIHNVAAATQPPNFIVILCDDLGYQDLGCFGSPLIKTPRIDQMAKEGMRFTSFYAQPVCGPSRTALMTGCYPLRVAKKENRVDVHFYVHTREVLIPEILKPLGYATAAFGKWDMAGHTQTGFEPALMPNKQGFDCFFGTPSSNDTLVNLLRNEKMVEQNADMSTLTRRYTDEAIGFITQHHTQPFFVYLAHTMPHVKLAASADFRGKSARGLYGDVVEEIDFNTGRLLDTLKALGLDENTYVIFTSDNGPWWIKGKDGGCALPLRGAKTSTWDGGERVPCIMRAPRKIPAGTVCDELTSTMDLLPTCSKLSSGRMPMDRVIDGHDISGLMRGEENATIPDNVFFFYQHTQLQAARSGRWKLVLPRSAATSVVPPAWAKMIAPEDRIEIKQPMLFDLQADIGEKKDVAAAHPEVVAELMKKIGWAREDIGDYNRIGKNARFFDPQPKRPDISQNPAKRRKLQKD